MREPNEQPNGVRSPPRIYVIPATAAPVAAVIRRGPSDWCQIGRWHLDSPSFEPGAWFRGTIPPQKCDLSPDGRWLAYSAVKYPSDWEGGPVYEAISRLPWLQALAAWSEGTTYTRGAHFVADRRHDGLGVPDAGQTAPIFARYGLALTRPAQFAVERRRGWTESADAPPREAGGAWDEGRAVEMRKPRPGEASPPVLCVRGGYAAFREMPNWHDPAEYWLEADGDVIPLDDLQWADWDDEGRLLAATTAGELEIRDLGNDGSTTVVFVEDLSTRRPDPQPAPSWASDW